MAAGLEEAHEGSVGKRGCEGVAYESGTHGLTSARSQFSANCQSRLRPKSLKESRSVSTAR